MIWSRDMKRLINISIIILLLMAAGYVAYYLVMDWHRAEIYQAKKQLREELKLQESPVIPKEKLIEAFGEEPAVDAPEKKNGAREEVERRLMAFFTYLDKQEYVQDHSLGLGTYQVFRHTVDTLSSNHPVIAGETESLFSLMKNMN